MDEAAARARRTYDAAADRYDALGFWAHWGARTVRRLALAPGAEVLDAPCGSGASALPAARVAGSVLGVDVSENQVALARAKAVAEGLGNATFRVGDMRALGGPGGRFDAVVSVFGIFFVEDMAGLARELWRMTRGALAVTTWGPGAFDPGASAFWDAVGDVRPELVRGFNPWDRLVTPEAVLDLFAAAGIPGAEAVAEDHDHPVDGPDGWWTVLLGSGYRATIDALSPEERAHVERRVRDAMADGPPMRAPAVLAVARR